MAQIHMGNPGQRNAEGARSDGRGALRNKGRRPENVSSVHSVDDSVADVKGQNSRRGHVAVGDEQASATVGFERQSDRTRKLVRRQARRGRREIGLTYDFDGGLSG